MAQLDFDRKTEVVSFLLERHLNIFNTYYLESQYSSSWYNFFLCLSIKSNTICKICARKLSLEICCFLRDTNQNTWFCSVRSIIEQKEVFRIWSLKLKHWGRTLETCFSHENPALRLQNRNVPKFCLLTEKSLTELMAHVWQQPNWEMPVPGYLSKVSETVQGWWRKSSIKIRP